MHKYTAHTSHAAETQIFYSILGGKKKHTEGVILKFVQSSTLVNLYFSGTERDAATGHVMTFVFFIPFFTVCFFIFVAAFTALLPAVLSLLVFPRKAFRLN